MSGPTDESWSSVSTQLLLAELRRRRENGDNERPACGTPDRGWYDTAGHVAALFIILTLSTAACGFPLLSRRTATGRRRKAIIFYCQHAGTGVLIATAFVHLLPTAFQSLNDPCLPPFFNQGYPPLPGVIAMIAAITVVGVESYLTARGAGHSHSHHHGWDDDDAADEYHDEHLHEMSGLRQRTAGEQGLPVSNAGDAESTSGLVAGASPLPVSSSPATQNAGTAHGDFDDGDSDLALEDAELTLNLGHTGNEDRYASLKPVGVSEPSTPLPMGPEERKRQMLQCMLLEAGILFHSVFIGMAISVATGPAFIVFLVAIGFHQTFEGLALGSRIAAIQFSSRSIKPWLMVLAYGMTTPIGQAIGLMVHTLYDPQSMSGLLVVGFMNAISAGLLLYAGLVQLLAEDFLTEKSYQVLKGTKRLRAFIAVIAGATLMAVVGAFA
ncbi:Zinc/iron permease [Stachybotrys elegans]|uniref:Zinc/iron permease n=1 Tax=Stachybotrys elegans TaxID=80388 RepID=A0A8K0WVQ5_9HYPO|nr:Zinc/iron permease [Stachybotrys elegans]